MDQATTDKENKAIVEFCGNLGGCIYDMISLWMQPFQIAESQARMSFVTSAESIGQSLIKFMEEFDSGR